MSTITKERLRERAREKVKSLEFAVTQTAFADTRAELEEELELARIALASLEAEPVGYFVRFDADDEDLIDQCSYNISGAFPLYSAPPAPVSAPYLLEQFAEFMAAESIKSGDYPDGWQCKASNAAHEYAQNIRAAMLQGAEPVTTSYKLPDDFDFDRFNDVVWLQAVASNPHMHSLTTSTIAMVALELNRKLADCNSPVIPDGWKLVPVEPTMEMLDEFDSIIDHGAEDSKEAWSRLIAAAPQQEVKP